MPNLPHQVEISIQDFSSLLAFYWTAVNSKQIGDLGSKSYEDVLSEIGKQSHIRVTPEQLENLVYHMKQVVFEKLKPITVDNRQKNYYSILRRLKDDVPQLFKTLSSGEIVFINFEDRENVK